MARMARMDSPFCTICAGLGDTEGRLACEVFPRGIPSAVYPHGCTARGQRACGFRPKNGMQETARRWAELDAQHQPG